LETLPQGKLRFIPLGGVGEIGKNLYAYHVLDQILIVDCGLKFPDSHMFGVDIVIPDVRWLIENKDAIQGIVITHGHEDHIGGLAYIAPELGCPVYAPPLAVGLAKDRLSERKVTDKVKLHAFGPDDVLQLGHFIVEPIRVSHSIPDSFALAIRTPAGTVIHTGDFKFDQTPVDGLLFDVVKLSRISSEGVLALVSDTTNVERSGYVPSEKIVAQTLERIVGDAKGRVIIASFASQIHRMQMAVDAAVKHGRKIATMGRSMSNNMDMASSLGYLKVPEGIRIKGDDVNSITDENLVILTTGSQGEPLAGLARMANDDHRQVRVNAGDTIVLSASPIPGNEDAVGSVINRLCAKGARVIHDGLMPVHVSGHGYVEDLKLCLNIVNPQYAIPVHGENRMLVQYARVAEEMGWLPEDIFTLDIGDVLEMDAESGQIVDRVPSGMVLIDGSDGAASGGVHEIVVKDRQVLSESGFITCSIVISAETGLLIAGPEFATRGFVYVDQNIDLLQEASEMVRDLITNRAEGSAEGRSEGRSIEVLQGDIRGNLKRFFEKKTSRRPVILPVVMEV
jgi:ribonuclease J